MSVRVLEYTKYKFLDDYENTIRLFKIKNSNYFSCSKRDGRFNLSTFFKLKSEENLAWIKSLGWDDREYTHRSMQDGPTLWMQKYIGEPFGEFPPISTMEKNELLEETRGDFSDKSIHRFLTREVFNEKVFYQKNNFVLEGRLTSGVVNFYPQDKEMVSFFEKSLGKVSELSSGENDLDIIRCFIRTFLYLPFLNNIVTLWTEEPPRSNSAIDIFSYKKNSRLLEKFLGLVESSRKLESKKVEENWNNDNEIFTRAHQKKLGEILFSSPYAEPFMIFFDAELWNNPHYLFYARTCNYIFSIELVRNILGKFSEWMIESFQNVYLQYREYVEGSKNYWESLYDFTQVVICFIEILRSIVAPFYLSRVKKYPVFLVPEAYNYENYKLVLGMFEGIEKIFEGVSEDGCVSD